MVGTSVTKVHHMFVVLERTMGMYTYCVETEIKHKVIDMSKLKKIFDT